MSSPPRSSTALAPCRRAPASAADRAPQAAARALGVRRLDLGPQGGYVLFEERNRVEPAAVVRMVQKSPREYRLEGALKLRVQRAVADRRGPLRVRRRLLKHLGKSAVR